jgi:hypothetical protein
MAPEALESLVVGVDQGRAFEHARQLREIDGLDLHKSNQEASQEFDSGSIPRYILGERALQEAHLSHCVNSFPISFGDERVRVSDNGFFFNYQRPVFCPVQRAEPFRTAKAAEPLISNRVR